jgi:hypothetical protein
MKRPVVARRTKGRGRQVEKSVGGCAAFYFESATRTVLPASAGAWERILNGKAAKLKAQVVSLAANGPLALSKFLDFQFHPVGGRRSSLSFPKIHQA